MSGASRLNDATCTTAGAGADMVIGTFEGTGTRKLMLIAHMDTVYAHGTLATEPYKVDGGRIYGPGIADDKGGIAVALHALKILKDAGWRDYAKLTVSFNPDEEVGSGDGAHGQRIVRGGGIDDREPDPLSLET